MTPPRKDAGYRRKLSFTQAFGITDAGGRGLRPVRPISGRLPANTLILPTPCKRVLLVYGNAHTRLI